MHKEVVRFARQLAWATVRVSDDGVRGALVEVADELSYAGLKSDAVDALIEAIDEVADEVAEYVEEKL